MIDSSNVLVTCGGKWVGMVMQLKEAMRDVPELCGGQIIVASMEELTPAGCFADVSVIVPPIRDVGYVDCLLDTCIRNRIRVLVPLIDLDLERLCPHLESFLEIGTTVVCPGPELVELCLDKYLFEQFAVGERLNYPKTYAVDDLHQAQFPLFFKKRRGFGSIGSGICESFDDAMRILHGDKDVLMQQCISAQEISVDGFISATGKCIVCVQRVREKVIAGEAYRSHTVSLPTVRDLAMRTINALAQRGLRGPLNVQIFDSDPPWLIEVNTRLGSASVFSNVASNGRLFRAVLTEACGGSSDGDPDEYILNLGMYRFLGEVYHIGADAIRIMPSR